MGARGVAGRGRVAAFITAGAGGGHAARPSRKDATAKLGAGLEAVQQNPPAAKLSAPVAAMLRELASHGSWALRLVFANLWLFRPVVIRIMKGDPETAAMVRTTYALTQLEGSPAHNVIPKQAKATVNVRVDPGETVDTAFARIKERFDEGTAYELAAVSAPSPIAPVHADPTEPRPTDPHHPAATTPYNTPPPQPAPPLPRGAAADSPSSPRGGPHSR